MLAWTSSLSCWVLLRLFLKKQGLLKIEERRDEGCEENTGWQGMNERLVNWERRLLQIILYKCTLTTKE